MDITQTAKWTGPHRDASMVSLAGPVFCMSGIVLSSLTSFETYLASTSMPLVHVVQGAVVPVYTVRYIESWRELGPMGTIPGSVGVSVF